MKVGLRIDVDTYRGARSGVPRLLRILSGRKIAATFFLSVGPDNMGRHLFRMLKPAFFKKMLRTEGASLYGWDIIFRGTLWPGPLIVNALRPHLKRMEDDGHEIGLHAYDHHRWQARVDRMGQREIKGEIGRGYNLLAPLLGRRPSAFAAPGWRSTNRSLQAEEGFGFRYSSGCRGKSLFSPEMEGRRLPLPQVPTTLPTYDESVGREGVSDSNYNECILERLREDALNVLAIHAEVEGMSRGILFEEFLRRAAKRGIEPVPLGALLPSDSSGLPAGKVIRGSIPGREGWLAVQAD